MNMHTHTKMISRAYATDTQSKSSDIAATVLAASSPPQILAACDAVESFLHKHTADQTRWFFSITFPTLICKIFGFDESSSASAAVKSMSPSGWIDIAALSNDSQLAGRFNEDDGVLSVHCNDQGVQYVQTKVNAHDLAEFLGQAGSGPNTEYMESSLVLLLPVMDHGPSSPLLGVQVNVFNNGGITIGIQILHKIADAFTIATFVNEWAHISLTGTMTKDSRLLSFGQLPSLFPARGLQLPSLDLNASTNYKTITRRFVLDALSIANLRKTMQDSSDQPTRLVAVMSLIWKVLAGISSSKNGNSRDSSLSFAINLRGKLSNMPSLQHALGNFVMMGLANTEDEGRKDELTEFVKLIRNTIRDTCVAVGKATSVDDISSLAVNNHTKGVEKWFQRDKTDIYGSTSWCKFPWYEADFGWGKPFWVSPVSFDTAEKTVLMDTKNGDGIQVMICLKENDMTEFERDPHILSYTSKLEFHSLG